MKNIHASFEGKSHLSTLLKFSLPSAFGSIIGLICVLTDRYFIGLVAGRDGMAAIALVFPYAMLINSFNFLFSGIAILAGISLGKKSHNEAEKYLTSGFLWILLIGVSLSIFLAITNTPLLRLFGATDSNIDYAKSYTRFLIPIATFQIFLGQSTLIRGIGDTITAMAVNICTGVLNVILDYVFILKLDMGISGAALATLIATAITGIYVVFYFLFSKNLRFNKKYLTFDVGVLKSVFAIGSPKFYNLILQSFLVVSTNRQAGVYGGSLATAAVGIVTTCRSVFTTSMQGFNQGASAIISYNYGARKFKNLIETFRIQVYVVSTISLILIFMVFTFPNDMVSFFVKSDKELIQFTSKYLRLNLCLMISTSIFLACNNFFQSIRESKVSTILFVMRIAVFNIPLLYILPLFIGDIGVWLAFPISDTLVAIIMSVLVSRKIKEFKPLITNKD